MIASKEEYHNRYSKCKSCNQFDDFLKKCKECGCYMPFKAKISWMKCPNGFWSTSESVTEVDTLEIIETHNGRTD